MASSLSLLVLASLNGCQKMRDRLMGIRETERLVYDDAVGTLYDYNPEIYFLGYHCEESFDGTEAVEEMGLSPLVKELRNEGISTVNLYARWDDDFSTYNTEKGWIVLNCEHFSKFSAWMLYDSENYVADSYTVLQCQYFSTYEEACLGEDPYNCFLP